MEPFGIYEAVRQLNVPTITVRGLSDLNGQKDRRDDAQWQPVAARDAATVAVGMLMWIHPGDLPARRTGPDPDADGDGDADNDNRRPIPPGADL